jgi:hypothetical protein
MAGMSAAVAERTRNLFPVYGWGRLLGAWTIVLAATSLCLLAFRAENLGIGTTNVISFQLLG